MSRKVSYFKNTFEKVPVATTEAHKLLFHIKSGKWADQVTELRRLIVEDQDAYREEKKGLPATTFSGTFNPERSADNLDEYSGLIIIDVDHITEAQAKEYKYHFGENELVYAAFISPSGQGLKILFKLDCTSDYHLSAFEGIKGYLENKYGMAVDKSGKDICRLCYVSYDPELYMNPSSSVWHVDTTIAPKIQTLQSRELLFTGKKVSSDVQYVFNVAKVWTERTHQYTDGNKNNYIHCIACTLNRCGVILEDAIFLIDRNFFTPDDKWHQSVKSAYHHNRHEHNSVNVYNLQKNENIAVLPEMADYSPEVVENDILQTTVKLLTHRLSVPDIRQVMHNYAYFYKQAGYIDLSDQILDDLMLRSHQSFLEYKKTMVSSGDYIEVQTMAEMFEDIMAKAMSESTMTTTFPAFDEVMGGGPKEGDFYGLIGREETYKSILSQWIAIENAKAGVPVMYFNGEMSKKQFFQRSLNKEFGVNMDLMIANKQHAKLRDYLAELEDLYKGCLTVVNGTGWGKNGILDAVKNESDKLGKAVRMIILDGVTQMDDIKNDEIKSTIHNTLLAKEIAKEADVAVIGLMHLSGNISKHYRNTVDNVRGSKKTIANMDGYFCTSLLIDPVTLDQMNDDIIYRPSMFYLRYKDKRGSGDMVSQLISAERPMKLTPLEFDLDKFEIQLK